MQNKQSHKLNKNSKHASKRTFSNRPNKIQKNNKKSVYTQNSRKITNFMEKDIDIISQFSPEQTEVCFSHNMDKYLPLI